MSDTTPQTADGKVLLGDGVRLYENAGGKPVRLHRVGDGDPVAAVNLRYRPA